MISRSSTTLPRSPLNSRSLAYGDASKSTGKIRIASGERAAAKAFRHKEFQKELSRLGISEQRIRCARSGGELRCLNNAIKHSQRVDDELAKFPRWQGKKG